MFSWLSNTRPEMACAANKAAEVTQKTFCSARVEGLNVSIKRMKITPDHGLVRKKLDDSSALIRIYMDASFASKDDFSSQLGNLVTVFDDSNRSSILDFKFKKSKRIVRSIMAGEVCVFIDGFDLGFTMTADLELLLKHRLNIYIFTDSKQLFDAITKGMHNMERRLMVDILAARQSYRCFEIKDVALIKGDVNAADALLKIKGSDSLYKMMVSGIDSAIVEHWVDSDKLPTKDYNRPFKKGGSVIVKP